MNEDDNFKEIKSHEIGNYVGQFKDEKRNGIGRLVVASPKEDINTIIEG